VETLFVETFYDTDGTPVKVVVHDGFTETDTNSLTRKTLNFSQTWVNTYDLIAGTRTVVGVLPAVLGAAEGGFQESTEGGIGVRRERVAIGHCDHAPVAVGAVPHGGDGAEEIACVADSDTARRLERSQPEAIGRTRQGTHQCKQPSRE
jgi:hypothetical protein